MPVPFLWPISSYQLCVAIFVVSIVQAQATPPPKLPKIVVHAPSSSRGTQFPSVKSFMDHSVVTKKLMNQQQYQTVSQAIQPLPGLVMTQMGNSGQPTSLFIRGTNSNHNQVRRDGMKLVGTDIQSGAFNFGTLRTTDLESIEVVRGPVTSLYGADAPGGVILLTTPVGSGSFNQTLSLEGGSRQTFNGYGQLSGEVKGTDLYMNLTRADTGGYNQTPHAYRIPGRTYSKLPNHQSLATIRFGQHLNEHLHVSLINHVSQADSKIQNRLKVTEASQETIFHRLFLNDTQGPCEMTWGAGYMKTHSEYDKKTPDALRADVSRFQVDGTGTWTPHQNHTLTVSAELGRDGVNNKQQQHLSKNPFKGHETQIGGGVFYRWTPPRLQLESSVRLDHFGKNKTYPTYRLGGRYEAIPQTYLMGSMGTAIKEPTVAQLYLKTPFVKGNPHLKAEEIRSYELGLSRYWFDRVKTEVIYFYNDIKNMIHYAFETRSLENHGKILTKGIEVIGKCQILSTLLLEGSYTYTHAKDLKTKEWLKRRPFNKWSLRTVYAVEDLTASAEFVYVGKRPDLHPLTFKPKDAKGYSQLGVRLEKILSNRRKLFGRIENCFNDRREDPLGYRRAGFGIYAGMEIAVG
jgi:vitamin B12 transporter